MRAALSVPPRCRARSPQSKAPSLVLMVFRTARFQRAHEARRMRAVRKNMTGLQRSRQTPDDRALDLDVALGDVLQVRPQMAMRLGQVVEGDVGEQVMLGVVGQVPHQEAYDGI